MSKFDNTINYFLENLIFEQDQDSQVDINEIISSTKKEIDNEIQNNDNYPIESQAKYEAGVDELIDELESLVSPFSDQLEKLKEDVDWGSVWGKTKDLGKSAAEKVGPVLHGAGEAVADKVGEIVDSFVDKKYSEDIQNNLSEDLWYRIVAVFEPTGVMSWPYYRKALDLYEQKKGTEEEDIYFLNLLAAQISVIPGVRMPLAVLTAPFKLITNPIMNIFGNRGKAYARAMAKETRSKLSKEESLVKASSQLKKGNFVGRGVQTVKTASRAVVGGTKSIIKPVGVGAKVATAAAAGDIPQKIRDWQKSGEEVVKNIKQPERTLGRFPSFGEISTQRA
jgi:hypothetical protein